MVQKLLRCFLSKRSDKNTSLGFMPQVHQLLVSLVAVVYGQRTGDQLTHLISRVHDSIGGDFVENR